MAVKPPAEVKSRRIVAVSYALQYLTQAIAGTDYSVEFPVAQTTNPREWSPSVAEIANIQQADLVVANGPGANYAQWLVRVTLPESMICNSCQNLDLGDYITVGDYQIVHAHGPEGKHSHPYFVPYPWLDPRIALKQAMEIRDHLTRLYPDSTEQFQANFRSLKIHLETIAKKLTEEIPVDGDSIEILSANPHLKYLSRACGVKDTHLFWFELPTKQDWAANQIVFEQRTEDSKATRILMVQKPDSEMVRFLLDRGIRVIEIDLLDHKPGDGDFLDAMRKNIASLEWHAEHN